MHVIPSLGGGGAERQLSLLTPALRAAGVEVHIAHVYGGEYAAGLAQDGAVLHPLPVRGHRDPRLLAAVFRVVRRLRPDLVHTWLPLADVVGGAAALACRIPWLLSERSVAEAYRNPLPSVRIRARLARYAAGVIANSDAGASYWSEVLPGERRFVVPNALPLAEIAAAVATPRSALPLPPGPPLVVYAGRFAPEKGIGVLVEALCMLANAGTAVALLCGEGPERKTAEAVVARQGLSDRIGFAGYCPNLWSHFKAAALLASVSEFEGTTNVVLEAAACGTPLVLSDIDAHRELFDGDGAYYVDRHDPAAVAAAVRRVLTEPAAAAERAAKARQQLSSRSAATAAESLMRAYRAATGRVSGVYA